MCQIDDTEDEPIRCRSCEKLLTEDELDAERPTLECTECTDRASIAFGHHSHGWCGRSDRHHSGFDPGFSEDQYEGE